jgi:cell division transport system ATP-binding protein
MEHREPIISFKGADIVNGESKVLYNVNLDVFPGDFVYIVGKVGTGKTSIIRTIIAENPLTEGKGYVCVYSLEDIEEKEIPFLRRKLGVVFQDFQLLMDRSVEDNLKFVLSATGWKNSDDISNRIDSVLRAVGMERKAHKMPHQLSGGEQQRIAIARALLNSPQVIIADEPTGNLDPETADGIMKLLSRINEENGTAIIMVTHNRQLFQEYPGRVMVCKDETCIEMANDDEESIELDALV